MHYRDRGQDREVSRFYRRQERAKEKVALDDHIENAFFIASDTPEIGGTIFARKGVSRKQLSELSSMVQEYSRVHS